MATTTDLTANSDPKGLPTGPIVIEFDLAVALAAKGSALADDDVFQIMTIPAGTYVDIATIHPKTAVTGATVITYDLGYGDDADQWVDGYNAMLITTEGVALPNAAIYFGAQDTLDITLLTITGTPVTGKVIVEVLARPMYAGMLPALKA